MRAKPVVLPPPKWVRRPKTWTCSFWALYRLPSFSLSSVLEMLARPGWRMSLFDENHRSVKLSWWKLWFKSLAAVRQDSSPCSLQIIRYPIQYPIDARCSILQQIVRGSTSNYPQARNGSRHGFPHKRIGSKIDGCLMDRDSMAGEVESGGGTTRGGFEDFTHTTICLRPSRGLRMNLRVRRVTGASLSAMVAMLCLVEKSDEGETRRFGVVVRSWEKGLAAKLKPGL